MRKIKWAANVRGCKNVKLFGREIKGVYSILCMLTMCDEQGTKHEASQDTNKSFHSVKVLCQCCRDEAL